MGLFTWIAIVALFFYLTPIGRLLTRPIRAMLGTRPEWKIPYPHFLVKVGRLEYLLGPLRDRALSILLLGIVVYRWWVESPIGRDTLIASSLIVFYNLLALLTIRHRDGVRLKLAELARVHSNIHPEDFFNLFYAQLSPWSPPFPQQGFRLVPYNDADYRTDEGPSQKFSPMFEAVLSTNTLARMAIMAFGRVGPDHGRDAFDGLARLWGSRVAHLFKMHLHTRLVDEAIPPLEGKTLLVFNHQSTLDFGLNFFALGNLRVRSHGDLGPGNRHLRPRFIAAKDHFIDNPFIYSWVGLGKVIENAGMIFINRRKKGMGWLAMQEAAEKLVNADVEIAVYPQGTRAYPLRCPSGDRQDAGFYTTFSKKTWRDPLGHLKPGTAHLIVDTLLQMKSHGQDHLNVLVVGISGAGIAGPKGNWRVQTQSEIEYRVASPWVIPTSFVDGVTFPQSRDPDLPEEKRYFEKMDQIQEELNRRMVEVLSWHQVLRRRMAEDLPKVGFSGDEIQSLQAWLDQADAGKDHRPYQLLDRILSLPPDLWNRLFRLWLGMRDTNAETQAFQALLQEVSEKLR